MDSESILHNASNRFQNQCVYYGTTNIETRFYTVLIFGTSLCAIAFFQSSFLFYLLTSRAKFRRSTLFYLAILSIFDVFLSPFWIMLQSVPIFYEHEKSVELYYAFLAYAPLIFTVSLTLLSASEYLILFASFENYLKTRISRGSKWVRVSKTFERNRGIVSACAILLATSLQISHFWEIDVFKVENCTGFEAYHLIDLDLTTSPTFNVIWTFYLRNVLDVFLPFFLLLYFNSCIMLSMKGQAHEFRQSTIKQYNPASSRVAKASTKAAVRALISDVLEYLISNVLNVILAFWETFAYDNLIYHHLDFYDYSADLVNILTVFFRTARLPIYCFCNAEIRTETLVEIRRLCRFLFCTKPQPQRKYAHSLVGSDSPCKEILLHSESCRNGGGAGERRAGDPDEIGLLLETCGGKAKRVRNGSARQLSVTFSETTL